jgi:fatty-acyl-CoA synthase
MIAPPEATPRPGTIAAGAGLAQLIERRATLSPADIAIVFEGTPIDGETLWRATLAMAGRLHGLGIAPGDRVAHLGVNNPAFLVLLFACARLGAILVPLNWRLAVPEHGYMLDDAGADLLIHDAAFAEHVAALAASRPSCRMLDLDSLAALPRDDATESVGGADSPVLIVYTSGTTGRPKGAVLTQGALIWNALNATLMHTLTAADHVLTTLPLFHVGGLNIQTLPVLLAGGRVTLHRRFDPAATLAAIAGDRPSLTVLVPAQMAALIAHPAWKTTDLSSLRMVATGSMIVPVLFIEAFHARGVPVVQVYGSTETAPIAIFLAREDHARRIGSCGRPGPHCVARIVGRDGADVAQGERGEILLRGPNLMREYWRNPAATEIAFAGGWFHTGDIGHQDEDGYFFVDERKNDLIISGGENIYPAELEAILAEEERIAEAVVVGRPDARWGEVPVAYVVLRPGAAITAEEIFARFAGRLARFKHPHAVVVTDALPKNALGKVLRYRLRETARKG